MSGKLTLLRDSDAPAALNSIGRGRRPLDARRRQLTLTLPRQAVRLEEDRVEPSQSLLNLLESAAKSTPEGGKHGLVAEVTGTEMALRVHNMGLSIPDAVVPRIFGLFDRGDYHFDCAPGARRSACPWCGATRRPRASGQCRTSPGQGK